MLYKIFKMTSCIVISIIVAAFIMTGLYCLPTEPMYKHAKENVELFENERLLNSWSNYNGNLGNHTTLNLFTDSIMIMQAIYPTSNFAIQDAMLNRRWLTGKNERPPQVLARNLKNESNQSVELQYEPFQHMDGTIDKENDSFIYPRYWHGYLLVLKPLLLITDVAGIREINAYIQFTLMIAAILLFYQKLGVLYAAAFTATLMSLNPISLAMSFQFDAIFYIMILSVIIILWKNKFLLENGIYPYIFLFIGIATAFFDFLTYPIVDFGITWLTYFALNKNESNVKSLKILGFHLFCWLFGYLGMWTGKLILAWILTGFNVVSDALAQAQFRSSNVIADDGTVLGALDAISVNFYVFFNDYLSLLFLLLFLWIGYHVKITKKFVETRKYYPPIIFVAILPILWYIIFTNHSIISIPMSYRNLILTEFAVFCLLIENIRRSET